MHTSHVTCYREHWPVINVISVTLSSIRVWSLRHPVLIGPHM